MAIRIGYGKNIRKRIADLRTAHPWPLELVAFIAGADQSAERGLHKRFAHLRIEASPGQEWFSPGPDLIAEIRLLRSEAAA